MGRVTRNICDRCGKEIKYIGWTAFIFKPKKVKIRQILNGNPTGYNYTDYDLELCRECTTDLDKFMFGAAIERSESRQKVVESRPFCREFKERRMKWNTGKTKQ